MLAFTFLAPKDHAQPQSADCKRSLTVPLHEVFESMRERRARVAIAPDRKDPGPSPPRSSFQRGEFVQLALNENDPDDRVRLVNLETGRRAEIHRGSLPWVAKFMGELDASDREVEFPKVADGRTLRYRVGRAHIFPLPNGRAQILRSVLACVRPVTTEFSSGEEVRFRDAGGLMREGLFPCRARPDKIFRNWTSGSPRSVSFDGSLLKGDLPYSISLGRPCGFLREYLDAAAQLSLHPEFQLASFTRQLELTMQFQNLVLPYTDAGDTLESTGIRSFSEVLNAGTGLCRHNSPLIAAVLSEAGLDVRLVHRIAEAAELLELGESHCAHVWVEVVAPWGETFIVDPSNRTVRSLSEAEARACQDHQSSDARWWSHPARERLDPVPLAD